MGNSNDDQVEEHGNLELEIYELFCDAITSGHIEEEE